MTNNYLIISLISLVSFINSFAQSPQFEWAYNQGGTSYDEAMDVAIGSNGEIIVVGDFRGTVQFGKSNKVSVSAGSTSDIFIHKTDSNGKTLWVKNYGGPNYNLAFAVDVDKNDNIYCTGYFSGSVDFDGDNITDISSKGGYDIFILKLDKDGNTLWANSIAGSSSNKGHDIAVDNNGNVYCTGFYSGSIDVDGDNSNDLTSKSSQDAYLLKLNKEGNFVWVKNVGGSSTEYGNGLTVDERGNIYMTGYFMNTTDFDGDDVTDFTTNQWSKDGFIQKRDSNGVSIWVKRIASTSDLSCEDISIDNKGNLYTTGYFSGNADFDNDGNTDSISKGGYDVFIASFDTSGNYRWAKQFGGTDWDYAYSVASDNYGNVFCTGYYSASVDYDFDNNDDLVAVKHKDIFVYQLDSIGTPIWADGKGSGNIDQANSIAIDSLGNLIVVGYHNAKLGYGPNVNDTLNIIGGDDMLIFKYSIDRPIATGINIVKSDDFNVYPNPANNFINVSGIKNIQEIKVLNIHGAVVLSANNNKIDISSLSSGLYLVSFKSGKNELYTKKFLKK